MKTSRGARAGPTLRPARNREQGEATRSRNSRRLGGRSHGSVVSAGVQCPDRARLAPAQPPTSLLLHARRGNGDRGDEELARNPHRVVRSRRAAWRANYTNGGPAPARALLPSRRGGGINAEIAVSPNLWIYLSPLLHDLLEMVLSARSKRRSLKILK